MISAIALCATVTSVHAQDAQSTTTEGAEENRRQQSEIVVTATLRSENLQDVPVSVTAIGSEDLVKGGVFDATGVAQNVPGLSFAEFTPGQALLSMRGVGSADDGAGLDNSVALFLDGIYVGRGAGVNFDLFDLERIEVLKGPQGALFGRNTIGGAISVVTQRPSTSELSVKAELTLGNEGIFRTQGFINIPIGDNVAAKIVASHREHDGYVRNTLLGIDVNNEKTTSVRGQLLANIGNSEWLLSGDYMRDNRTDAGRFPFVNGNFDYIGTAITLGAGSPQTTASPIRGFNFREVGGVSLHGDLDLGAVRVTSITGYRHVLSRFDLPSVGAPLGGGFNFGDLNNPADDVYGLDVNDDIDEKINTFSQELRLTSAFDGPLEFVSGLFFFTEKTDREEQFKLDRNSVATGQVTIGNEYTRTQNKTTSFAAYAQASWEFSEAWKLLIGGRFSHDKKDYVASAVNCALPEETRAAAGFPNFAPCDGVSGSLRIIAEVFRAPSKVSFSDFSPMISLQFRPSPDMMLFGTVSTGFKSGGFAGSQGVESAASNPVNPENVTNFELGLKSELFDRALRFNATAFYMDYKDLQVVRFGPVPSSAFGTFLTTNIGKAEIFGAEVEFDWNITDNFNISGNYAYLNTEVKNFVINNVDVSGKTLRQAPKHSFSVVADYRIPMNSGAEIDMRVQFIHSGQQRTDFINDNTIIQEQNLLQARIGWTSANERFGISVWGKNLTDEAYVAHSYIIGPGVIGIWGPPRTFGATLQVKY